MVEKTELILAKDGIFPVTRDENGILLPSIPASGFSFSGTVQGEGKLNGIPSLFVRLAGCNLHCTWKMSDGRLVACDTAYASFELKNTSKIPVEKIHRILRANRDNIQHIVITGGEPLLQATPLIRLCSKLKEDEFHLTIETNATLYDEELARYIDLFSLSPKLASSVNDSSGRERIRADYIQSYIDHCRKFEKDFQLKFVYSAENDVAEIKSLLSSLHGWKNEDILLMPLGADVETLRINTQKTLAHCIRNGWRFCDRLHISLFGTKDGV